MRVRTGLLWFLVRQTRPVTLGAASAAVIYVLLTPAVLNERAAGPAFFVLVHASLMASLLGRSRAGDVAFLYTRGYGCGFWSNSRHLGTVVWGFDCCHDIAANSRTRLQKIASIFLNTKLGTIRRKTCFNPCGDIWHERASSRTRSIKKDFRFICFYKMN